MPANDNHPEPALISINECCRETTLSRTAINILRAAGDFPLAVELGERRVAFVRAEFRDWLSERIARRAARAA